MSHFRLSLPVVLSLVAASGCGARQEPCTESCPDLSGVYTLADAFLLGECAFTPYLLPPSVRLLQSDNGRQVTLTVIDPALQLEVPMVGDVYGPRDEPDLIGSFRIETRTTRTTSRSDDTLVTLNVIATGSVSQHEGRRVLSATLSTQDALSRQSCLTTLSVIGQGE